MKELLQQALDALNDYTIDENTGRCNGCGKQYDEPHHEPCKVAAAMAALRSALAAPAAEPCWCQTCRPITLGDMRMVLCPTCGNKRCPRATDHRNACTNSNKPGQAGSSYATPPAIVPECCRNELVTAIHGLASNFENSLYAFRDDTEARRKAVGDIAHAMKIAAKHNRNGPGCATPAQPAVREPQDERAAFEAWHSEYRGLVPLRRDDSYFDTHARLRWEGWQARAHGIGITGGGKNCDRPGCPAGGRGPCAQCEREYTGGAHG